MPARARKRSIHELKNKVIDQFLDVKPSDLTRFKRLLYSLVKIVVMVARAANSSYEDYRKRSMVSRLNFAPNSSASHAAAVCNAIC